MNIDDKRTVNRHYVGVIKEVGDYLQYEEVDIPQEDMLINDIEAIKGNTNRTLMDVQTHFTEFYPEEEFKDQYFNYLYPESYDSTYVKGATYPNILTYTDYKKMINDREEWYRSEKYLEKCPIKDELNQLKKEEEKYHKRVESHIREKMRDYVKELREGFKYQHFIFAKNYTRTLQVVLEDTDVRMYSTDQIGWKTFEYKVNDDITIFINSNFGYGRSSYFFCNLKYKDMNILPYTWVVKYYYVKMIDFIRYTRRFSVKRDSWNEVFDFTVETANLAKHEPEIFIKEWIVNEVEEMMKGIRNYLSRPQKELETFLNIDENRKNVDIDAYYNVIRNCTNDDIEEYKTLPNEKVMAFKAEKITGCLLLLDNLRKLSEIAKVITPYIAEIEQMNLDILPEIESYIQKITLDLQRLNEKLNVVLRRLDSLEQELESHKQVIIQMQINMFGINTKGIGSYYKKSEEKYIISHPEYTMLMNKIHMITEEEFNINLEISRRDSFLNILKASKNRIFDFVHVA